MSKIKKLIDDKGIKQKKLAEAAGVSGAYMSLIIQGKRSPTVGILKKIADFLGVTIDELLDEAA